MRQSRHGTAGSVIVWSGGVMLGMLGHGSRGGSWSVKASHGVSWFGSQGNARSGKMGRGPVMSGKAMQGMASRGEPVEVWQCLVSWGMVC